ncbi:MAG: hemerythrin domain-containing protein, partial [Pseudomonadota bacterium]
KAPADGFDDASWRDFADAAHELVEREIFHIQKEEMGLLAAISALVDPATDQRLAEAYQGVMA